MSERQRAERFADLLDEASGVRRHHRRTEIDPDVTSLAVTARQVGSVPAPRPSEEFRDGLRALLMATAEREGIGTTETVKAEQAAARAAMSSRTQVVRQIRPARSGRTRAAAAIGVAVGALALSGVSLASSNAVPGDALYSVKRSSEQAQLVLAGSDANRGQLHLEFARSRLVEARQVDAGLFDAVLSTMNGEVRSGARLLFTASLQRGERSGADTVIAVVQQLRTDIVGLQQSLPQAHAALQRSLDLLRLVEDRANLVEAAIAGSCTFATTDDLGPKPSC